LPLPPLPTPTRDYILAALSANHTASQTHPCRRSLGKWVPCRRSFSRVNTPTPCSCTLHPNPILALRSFSLTSTLHCSPLHQPYST
jgi:hypothetical protein